MPSFDVVSEVDMQEVLNAVDQVRREVDTRFDFKGSVVELDLDQKAGAVTVVAPDALKLKAVEQMLRERLAKRGVSPKSVTFGEPARASGDTLRQLVTVKTSLDAEELKKLGKEIKSAKLKVQAQVQGEQLRVTGKKRDDLQETMSRLRGAFPDLELQFTNFRD